MSTALLRPTTDTRWAQEVRSMQTWYPSFVHLERPRHRDLLAVAETPLEALERTACRELVKVWRGWITPFSDDLSEEETNNIIADLKDDMTVGVGVNGSLRHLASCTRAHTLPDELRPRRRLNDSYLIEIACRVPPAHPIVRSLDPLIVSEFYGDDPKAQPPHLLQPLRALCVMFPPDGAWEWERGDGIRDYADHTAIWLAKHSVWLETRDRLGITRGIWIGSETRHEPKEMLSRLKPGDECHCGSGRAYESCCRGSDAWPLWSGRTR